MGGDLQYHHNITFDDLYITLIKRVELELQINYHWMLRLQPS